MLFQDRSAYTCAGQDEAEDQAGRAAADDTAARRSYGSVHVSNLCAPEVAETLCFHARELLEACSRHPAL